MNTKKTLFFALIFALLVLSLGACAPAAPEAAAPVEEAAPEEAAPAEEPPAEEAPAEEAPAEMQDFVTWYQYDEKNEDPASNEHVGNAYLRDTMPQFNEAFAGTWNWVNTPKAYDKMAAELVAAVQASGEVPDLYEMNSDQLNAFYRNGTLQDMGEWAKQQPWYADMDASALGACTGPDGGLYCIPISQRPQIVYVWTDHFPDGYPATPAEFLVQAEALKAEGIYAMTYYGANDKGGKAIKRATNSVITAFGGGFDDGNGNMLLNTAENIAAIEFLRTLTVEGYVPEVTFAGGFQEEEPFKDGTAGSIPSGLNGYRYLNPLVAPNGTAYETVEAAVAAGDMIMSPVFAVEGQVPTCDTGTAGFGIPAGAANVDAAHDYINWVMAPEQNSNWVVGPGGGFPVMGATQSSEAFSEPYFQQSAEAITASSCSPWYGSLERPGDAQMLAMATIYNLVKEDTSADIAEALAETEAEYNAGNQSLLQRITQYIIRCNSL